MDNNKESLMDVKNENVIQEKAKNQNIIFSNDSATNTSSDIDINSTNLYVNDISKNDGNKQDIKNAYIYNFIFNELKLNSLFSYIFLIYNLSFALIIIYIKYQKFL